MSKKRCNHSPEFKAKVALVALKGDKTLAELLVQYQLHAKIGQITMENDFLSKVLGR